MIESLNSISHSDTLLLLISAYDMLVEWLHSASQRFTASLASASNLHLILEKVVCQIAVYLQSHLWLTLPISVPSILG